MLPVCPRCATRVSGQEIAGRFPPARVKCRHCGAPLKMVWRPMSLVAAWSGIGLLAWTASQLVSRGEMQVLVWIAAGLAAGFTSLMGIGLVERDVAHDGREFEPQGPRQEPLD